MTKPTYQPAPTHNWPQLHDDAALVRTHGAWRVWWLVVITAGIYYFVWYERINRELALVLGIDVPPDGRWWSQLIPVYRLIGLARTAKRVNAAHASVGSRTRVSVIVSWLFAPAWCASHTRYLQRRINILHDVLAEISVIGEPVDASQP